MPTARVFRVKKRGIMDIHATAIRPRIVAAMDDLGRKIIREAKQNHGYKDRTGALTKSMRWYFPVYRNNRYTLVITAGGDSTVQFSHDITNRKTNHNWSKRFKRNRRKGAEVRRGQAMFVIYAPFVERRGYSVLVDPFEKYKHEAIRIFGHELKLRGV